MSNRQFITSAGIRTFNSQKDFLTIRCTPGANHGQRSVIFLDLETLHAISVRLIADLVWQWIMHSVQFIEAI